MKTSLDWIVARRVTDALYDDRALRREAAVIRIGSEEGIVTLEGTMSCLAVKDRAYKAARAVEGVFQVENRLTVRAP